MKNWWKKYKKFRILTWSDKSLIIRIFFYICLIKLGLTLLPFHKFRHWFNQLFIGVPPKTYPDAYVEKVVWAVKAVSYNLPFSILCLPQALATKYLLRGDFMYKLTIGVNTENQNFRAHAWVEKQQQIIIGDTPLTAYVPIWIWE